MSLSLLDWRRRVAALYSDVRNTSGGDDAANATARFRAGRDDLFRGHTDSPLRPARRHAFRGLPYAPYDPAVRFVATVDDVAPERLLVDRSDGQTVPFTRFGRVELPIGTLDVFWLETYGGGVFLPFRDATAGTTTYGGGRYLLDTAKGADLGGDAGTLVLDFNYAYHPSCFYDPERWGCPLAPASNWLDVRVDAGELVTP